MAGPSRFVTPNQEFVLRPAEERDAPRIRAMVRRERLNPMSLNWRHFTLAVDGGGSVIGCGQVKTVSEGTRELASLVVETGWRRRGVAGALIRRLKEEAGPPLWLTCLSGLAPYYASFGFRTVEPDDPQPKYYRRLRRIAGVVGMLAGASQTLTVMRWSG
ncbi:MAG: GNAT family N-acetyltransferase [Anaerolineales bacterium]